MAKKQPSRVVFYAVVGGIVLWAIMFLTAPDAPTTTHRRILSTTTQVLDSNDLITPEDLTAHFPRYTGKGHDPFAPFVVVAKPQSLTTLAGQTRRLAASAGVTQGDWTLTGINNINGQPSALVENTTTSDTEFLHAGDTWHSLKVTGIEADAVDFVNVLGKPVRLAFSDPGVASGDATLPKNTVTSISAGPPTTIVIQPLPPMPTATPAPQPTQDQNFSQPIIINEPNQSSSDNGDAQSQQGPPQGPPPGPPSP